MTARAGDDRGRKVRLDVVIPVWNEEAALDLLFRRLDAAFAPAALERHGIASVRYLFVDDGSQDASPGIVAERIRQGAGAALVRLSRNFGHQNAVSAGLDHVGADVAAVIDADLQDPPELILDMVDRWREGFDVVLAKTDLIPVFCEAMAVSLADLVRQVSPRIESRDIAELPLLTFGSYLQGQNNTAIGKQATQDVFLVIADLVKPFIIERTERRLKVKNASKRIERRMV